MYKNKLKLLQHILKKTTALSLIIGLLTTSYGAHLQFSAVSAQDTKWQNVLSENQQRPDICIASSISNSESTYESIINLNASFSEPVAAVSFMFYNLDNIREDNTPEIIEFTDGQPAGITTTYDNLTTQTQATLKTITLKHTDKNTGKIPSRIQINTYGTLPDGRISQADPACVTYLNLSTQSTTQPTTTPTPTATPSSISTPTPSVIPTITPTLQPTISPTPSTPPQTTTPQPTTSSTPSQSPRSITFPLNEVNNSGQSGTATIRDIGNNQIEVALNLQGGSYNNQPAHVHTGTCFAPGNIIYRLSNIVNNHSSTVISISFDTLVQQNSITNAIIEAHRSQTDMTPTVCGPGGGALPSSMPSPTQSADPTAITTPTVQPSVTTTPATTPTTAPAGISRIAFCMYNDENGNGNLEPGEDKISWEFNYKINNNTSNNITSNWWNFLSDGCANIEIAKNAQISVDEEVRQGWSNTAIWENGRKTGTANQPYTFTVIEEEYQIWFLASRTDTPTISPSFSPSPSLSSSASPSAAPTDTPTASNSNTLQPNSTNSPSPSPTQYDVRIEKIIPANGAEVRGDNVGIQYQIKVRNNADRDLTIRVIDELERTFTYDQNTTSGDVLFNPMIEDINGDDNRRLIWNDIRLNRGQEKTFSYRTTGRYEDRQFCNSARVETEGAIRSESRACIRANKTEGQVLAATTQAIGGGPKQLPATGGITLAIGLGFLSISILGFKLARYGENL